MAVIIVIGKLAMEETMHVVYCDSICECSSIPFTISSTKPTQTLNIYYHRYVGLAAQTHTSCPISCHMSARRVTRAAVTAATVCATIEYVKYEGD